MGISICAKIPIIPTNRYFIKYFMTEDLDELLLNINLNDTYFSFREIELDEKYFFHRNI